MLRSSLRVLLLLCLLIGTGTPLRAQETILPPLAPLSSMRGHIALAFNGQPLQVCQTEWERFVRFHSVCHDLVTTTLASGATLTAGTVQEVVAYDGTRYTRLNAETMWSKRPGRQFPPDTPMNFRYSPENQGVVGAPLTRIGTTTVRGTPATQYQYWATDPALRAELGGQMVYDIFLSAENRVLRDQFSLRGSLPNLGTGEFIQVTDYYDFNAPIVVGPPPASVVR